MRSGIRVILALVVIWVIAAVVIYIVHAMRPTPESLEAYLKKHPMQSVAGDQREKVIEAAANQLNSLSYEQRQQIRDQGEIRNFFEQLTPEEKNRFLDLTLPEGFHQLMTALNNMTPEKRKKIVQRALDDMDRNDPPARRPDDAETKKIIGQGMSSFYEDADADVKLDFAPVIEKMQRQTQNLQ